MDLQPSNWQWIPIIGALGIVALGIVAGIGWWLIARHRRHLLSQDDTATPWTLEQLEDMRQAGQLTDEEFRILRNQAMAGFLSSGQANRPGKSTSPGGPNDNIRT